MLLKLVNNLTKVEYEIDVEDKGTSGSFYDFDITLPTPMVDGEYTYQLSDNDKVVATGLCQIGDYIKQATSYNKKEKYVTYNG